MRISITILAAFLIFPCSAKESVVATFHPQATEAAVQILNSGGNAFDAFVAATFAEYVVHEGGTSPAGSLGALIYDARTRKTLYLDAEFNSVLDSSGEWDYRKAWTASDRESGKAVAVPGAVAGLEALTKRYGRKSFAENLRHAIDLAANGFRVAGFYRAALIVSAEALKRDAYASRMFFPGGSVLKSGDLFRQPELAEFLNGLARDGSAYMYKGAWAGRCVDAVRKAGGRMTAKDLARYQPEWREPWRITYRNHEVLSSSGRAFGGLWSLLALKTLEHTNISRLGHYSSSAGALELMVRTSRQALAESWLYDYRQLDRPDVISPRLSREFTQKIWARVRGQIPAESMRPAGSNSYQIVVVDAEGNAITGTNTHESLAWGNQTFVQGVPLNTAARIPWATQPGQRRLSPFAVHMVMSGGRLRAATGAFSSSLLEASFQFLVNIIDYNLSANDAVTRPRFGTFPYDPAAALTQSISGTLAANTPNWLDPRVSPEVVAALQKRGLLFVQRQSAPAGGWVDTGMGAVAVIRTVGKPEAATTAWVEMAGPPGAVRTVSEGKASLR